jgi:integrase
MWECETDQLARKANREDTSICQARGVGMINYNDRQFLYDNENDQSPHQAGQPPSGHDREPRSLANLLQEFQNMLQDRYDAASTKRVYQSRLHQLRLFISEVLHEDETALKADDFNRIAIAFMNHLQVDRQITSFTFNNYVSFLSLIAYLSGAPLRGLQRMSSVLDEEQQQNRQRQDLLQCLSRDDIQACMQAARLKGCKRTELLFSLMLHAGITLSRCLQLRMDDCIFEKEECIITVRNSRMEKVLKLPAHTTALLQEWLKQRQQIIGSETNPFIFPGKNGTLSKTAAEWSLRSIGWPLGLCVSPKSLRKTYRQSINLTAS